MAQQDDGSAAAVDAIAVADAAVAAVVLGRSPFSPCYIAGVVETTSVEAVHDPVTAAADSAAAATACVPWTAAALALSSSPGCAVP